jgi:hypothetical protein
LERAFKDPGIFSKSQNGGGDGNYFLSIGRGGGPTQAKFGVTSTAGYTCGPPSAALNAGQWYHLACAYALKNEGALSENSFRNVLVRMMVYTTEFLQKAITLDKSCIEMARAERAFVQETIQQWVNRNNFNI